jgi:hypothetical protein
MNFDGMIILSCSVIEKVLSAQKEAFFHFWWDGFIIGVQRRIDGPHADTINLKSCALYQLFCPHNYAGVPEEKLYPEKRPCFFFSFSSLLEDNKNMQERF